MCERSCSEEELESCRLETVCSVSLRKSAYMCVSTFFQERSFQERAFQNSEQRERES